MTLTFLTPWGILLGAAGLVPVALTLHKERTASRARNVLGLAHPPRRRRFARLLLLAVGFALLALAAGHPLVQAQHTQRERKDAQLMFVLDNSRSMLASRGRHGTPRWQRAIADAEQIHAALPDVAAGVVALNDRLLPYLFPTTQESVLHLVLHDAYAVDRPVPSTQTHWTTYLGALSALTNGYFVDDTRHKVAVVLTDGETRTYSPFNLEQALEEKGIDLVYVRVWDARERIYRAGGKTERYTPLSPAILGFAQTGNAKLYREAQLAAAIADVRTRIGSGPTREVATSRRNVSIGGQLALLALCAFLLALVPGLPLPSRRRKPLPEAAPRPSRLPARVAHRPEPAARA
jgi:hypothetical protein